MEQSEIERLHKIGAATVQRMREEHGMTHKFPTGAEAYGQEPEPFRGDPKTARRFVFVSDRTRRKMSVSQTIRQQRERAEKEKPDEQISERG